jgi:hypothetical protein
MKAAIVNGPVAAVIGGIFAVTAVVVGIVLSHNHNPPSQSTLTPTSPYTVPASRPSGIISSSTQGPSPAIRWQGPLTVGTPGTYGSSSVELDTLPPSTDSQSGTITTVSAYGVPLSLWASGGAFVTWNHSWRPNYLQCRNLVQQQVGGSTSVKPGLQLCIKTGFGRIAYLDFTNGSSSEATANVTVWDG